jgi:predicted nuclease with TOPRIM domain
MRFIEGTEKGGDNMRNLMVWILVAGVVILGFFANQSSQQVRALQADLALKTEAATALESEKAALTDQLATSGEQADQAAKAVADKVAALEAENAGLTEKITALEAEASALSEKAAGLEAQNAGLTEQIAALEAENTATTDRANAVETEMLDMAARISTLEAEKVALTEQAAALQAQVDALSAADGGTTTTNP